MIRKVPFFKVFILVLMLSSCSDNLSYLNMDQVYSEYDFQLDMFKKFKNETFEQGKKIDSLKNEMVILQNAFQSKIEIDSSIVFKKKRIVFELNNVQKENNELKKSLNKKIYGRIGDGLKKYCEKEDINILYNAHSGTNILYIDSTKDVTNKFINYLNATYQGN